MTEVIALLLASVDMSIANAESGSGLVVVFAHFLRHRSDLALVWKLGSCWLWWLKKRQKHFCSTNQCWILAIEHLLIKNALKIFAVIFLTRGLILTTEILHPSLLAHSKCFWKFRGENFRLPPKPKYNVRWSLLHLRSWFWESRSQACKVLWN